MAGMAIVQRLSVIMPVLNEEATIAHALTALQPLRAQGHELIVVDCGSGDRTVQLVQGLADRIAVTQPGRALQMNHGAGLATGDALLFLHVDSSLPDGAVEAIATALVSGARWGRFDVAIDGRPRILKLVSLMMNLRSRLTGIATGDQGIFMQRDLFEKAGGYAPIPLMEDVAMSKRLKRLAGRPACLAARVVTSGRRWEAHGPWRTIVVMWRLRLAYALGADPTRLARLYR
jgi:rSAM/selenodomain-associated transferase 2